MSSNPYVVRTDAYLGFLQKKDLIPQNIAVGKLKIDCYCSGLLQQLQNEYLNLFSTIPKSPNIGQLLWDIQEIQRLQTEFQANEYTSMKELKLAHENLKIALNNIKSIPKKEGKMSYFQELKKNAQPPNTGLPPTPFKETDEQRVSRLLFEKQQKEVEDSENKYNEEILAIEKKNKQDFIQLEHQRVARERNAELFRVKAENQKNFNDRETTLRQKREQQAAEQLEHEKQIDELRKKEAEHQNELNELLKRFHHYKVHPALPQNQALPPLIPEGPKPYVYEDNLSILAMLLAENEEKTAQLENQRPSGKSQVSDYIVQMTTLEPQAVPTQRPEPPAPAVPMQRPEPPAPAVPMQRPEPPAQANTNVSFGVGSDPVPPPPPPPPAPGAMPKRADANPVETGQPSQTGNTAPPPKNAKPKQEAPVDPHTAALLAAIAKREANKANAQANAEANAEANKANAEANAEANKAEAEAVERPSSGVLNVNNMIGMSAKFKAHAAARTGKSDTNPGEWDN
jgi:hypothetical protein